MKRDAAKRIGIVTVAMLATFAWSGTQAVEGAKSPSAAVSATGASLAGAVVVAQGLERDGRTRFRIDDSLGDPPRVDARKGGLDGMPGHGIGTYTGSGVGSYTGRGLGSYTGGGLGNLGGGPAPRTTLDGRGLDRR